MPLSQMTSSSSERWVAYFRQNRFDRPEPDWGHPCNLPATVAVPVARSLAHFQLGESGDGAVLLAKARRACPDDPDLIGALELFVAEEQEHARLLAGLVHHLGGHLVHRHWTQAVFALLRRRLGLRFELEVLLVAEVIGTAYYRLLRQGAPDPVLRQVCDVLLRDEAQHLAFHRQQLQTTVPGPLLAVAARAAWLDHRRALRSAGTHRAGFLAEVRRLGSARSEAACHGGNHAHHGRAQGLPQAGQPARRGGRARRDPW